MDDLIDWFAEANGFSGGTKAPHKWVLQAEQELRIQTAALSEAQATIARLEDQVGDWIVRADEANVRADRLEVALRSIAANTCCEGCQEAARVASAALSPREGEG